MRAPYRQTAKHNPRHQFLQSILLWFAVKRNVEESSSNFNILTMWQPQT